VGTGSGIVAIAAARLGASRVCGVDRDPHALAAAADGLQRNAVNRCVDLKQADAFVDVLGEFDLVTANLEAAQIAGGAERLLSHVRPGGQLLLSGFLTAEFDKIRGAFSQSPTLMEHDDGWTAVVLTRSADALA
jgi:ribosomal protein L11 methyltransferase